VQISIQDVEDGSVEITQLRKTLESLPKGKSAKFFDLKPELVQKLRTAAYNFACAYKIRVKTELLGETGLEVWFPEDVPSVIVKAPGIRIRF
jgi:hypothetical protein